MLTAAELTVLRASRVEPSPDPMAPHLALDVAVHNAHVSDIVHGTFHRKKKRFAPKVVLVARQCDAHYGSVE